MVTAANTLCFSTLQSFALWVAPWLENRKKTHIFSISVLLKPLTGSEKSGFTTTNTAGRNVVLQYHQFSQKFIPQNRSFSTLCESSQVIKNNKIFTFSTVRGVQSWTFHLSGKMGWNPVVRYCRSENFIVFELFSDSFYFFTTLTKISLKFPQLVGNDRNRANSAKKFNIAHRYGTSPHDRNYSSLAADN